MLFVDECAIEEIVTKHLNNVPENWPLNTDLYCPRKSSKKFLFKNENTN